MMRRQSVRISNWIRQSFRVDFMLLGFLGQGRFGFDTQESIIQMVGLFFNLLSPDPILS